MAVRKFIGKIIGQEMKSGGENFNFFSNLKYV